MYVKNFKVPLTEFESLFINYIISNDGYCHMPQFERYLKQIRGNNIPKTSLVVEINRFRRRVIYQTGFPILKSMYGYGYVINS